MTIYFNSYFSVVDDSVPVRVTAFVWQVIDGLRQKLAYTDATEELALAGLKEMLKDWEIEL